VLARLSRIPHVAAAQVDATGRHFVLLPSEGADLDAVVAQALQILGTDSSHLKGPGIESQIGGFDLDELWVSSDNIRRLSLLEARMLAANWGEAAAKEAGLSGQETRHLVDLLRAELMKELDRVHAGGGTAERNWYRRSFPDAFERTIAAMEAISPSQAGSLKGSLLRLLNG
jgi:hypothetical protein